MSALKILVFPADLEACGHYRLIWPAMTIKDVTDYDIRIIPPQDRGSTLLAEIDEFDNVAKARCTVDADVLVFQRLTHKYLSQAIPMFVEQGYHVVVDMDDDLETISQTNPAWAVYHPRSGVRSVVEKHSWLHARDACRNASATTLSSLALLERYGYGHGTVIRNFVPEHYLAIPWDDSTVIGWGGSMRSHAEDVPVMGSSIRRLIDEGHGFIQVGPPGGLKDALRLSEEPVSTGPVTMDLWAQTLAENIGIGVAPLATTKFNRAKSRLKPLEYASLGIPMVMSDVDEYRAFHDNFGIGLLARKPQNWYQRLKQLLDNEEYRQGQALFAREMAMKLTIQANIERWIKVWTPKKRRQRATALPGSALGVMSAKITHS
jgi:hypothetical protein